MDNDRLDAEMKEFQELKAAFNAVDADGNGVLSADEIKNVIKKLGIQADENETKEFLNCVDKNHDGKITFVEFAKASRSKFYSKKDKNTFLAEFKKYDKGNNGFITADEVYAVLSKSRANFTQDEAKKLVAKADKNGDGKINILEFLGLFD